MVASAVSLVICIIMIYVYHTRKTYNGFTHWTLAAVLLFSGMFLLGMRKYWPEFMTIITANTFIASYSVLTAYGINLFFYKTVRKWMFIAPVALIILTFTYFTYMDNNIRARIVIITAHAVVFFLYCAYCVKIESKRIKQSPNLLVISACLIQALYLLFRIVYTICIDKNIQNFMAASTIQAVSFFFSIGGNIMLFAGFIIMTSQRIENELFEANREIKQLKGILPICSHCKKIRDDAGYWNQIETYIQDHSDAEFSHGICKECAEKYYPGMGLYDDNGT
jgi:hypothetical protein